MLRTILLTALLICVSAATAFSQGSPVVTYSPMPNIHAIVGAANMDNDPQDEIVIVVSNSRLMIIDSATGATEFDSESWNWTYVYPPGYDHEGFGTNAAGYQHGYDPFCDKNDDGLADLMLIISTDSIYEQHLAVICLANQGPVSTTGNAVPAAAELGRNRPNPFNPSTSIDFTLNVEGPAVVRIFDVAGRHVRTLVNESLTAGRHSAEWDGTDESGRHLASGTYFYQLEAGGRLATRKAMLLK